MTLNGRYALCSRKDASFGAHLKKLNEDRPIGPYYQRQKCRSLTLISPPRILLRELQIIKTSLGTPWLDNQGTMVTKVTKGPANLNLDDNVRGHVDPRLRACPGAAWLSLLGGRAKEEMSNFLVDIEV